jgi:hypothetical protein
MWQLVCVVRFNWLSSVNWNVQHVPTVSGLTRKFIWVVEVGFAGIFFGEGSTNSVEDREQRDWRSEVGVPLVRGSTQFANEWNPDTYYVVTDLFFTDLGIWLSCGIWGVWTAPNPLRRYTTANCHIYTLLPPDGGLLASPKRVEV